MLAAVLEEDRPRLALREVPDPVPGAGEVVVRVRACGVCGSDLHVASSLAAAGTVLGHEIAGVVEAVGPGAERWKVGTPVTGRPFFGCGRCRFCAAGRPDHCADFALVGFNRNGGFGEVTVLSADELFELPTSLEPVEQALVEPLAVARRTLRRGGLAAGEAVTVLGAGPIGLAVVQWARALGAGRITVSDPVPARRHLALTLGADQAVEPDEIVEAAGAPPLVVECSGRPGVIDQALQLVDVEGRVAVVGICTTHDTFFPWWGLNKEVDLRFAMYYGREDFVEAIARLEDGSLQPAPMVVEHLDLAGLADRFHELVVDPGNGKTVVIP